MPKKQQLVPKMKGEENWTLTQQLLKIQEELDETLQASGENYIEEIGDLLHAFWVFIRILQREGIDAYTAVERVVDKNRARGYYDEPTETSQTA